MPSSGLEGQEGFSEGLVFQLNLNRVTAQIPVGQTAQDMSGKLGPFLGTEVLCLNITHKGAFLDKVLFNFPET